eukprot:XP_019919185.1 PREDICTED: receptor-type tyrosine-protein phosphatase alpha-like [Crassostrea gigas]
MVDYECRTIICLNPQHNIKSSKAWMPSPSSEKIISPYRVFCYTCRDTDLKVSTLYINKEKEEPFCITVAEPKYEFGSETQKDVTSLCNLVSFALDRPSNSPIAVVSMDGASMCGVFCAVFNSIQQITMDDNIDVFTTVRQLQKRRPEFCATQDEYGLIYHAIYNYLQGMSEYDCLDQ